MNNCRQMYNGIEKCNFLRNLYYNKRPFYRFTQITSFSLSDNVYNMT